MVPSSPATQRAVLILRDLPGFSAHEVAGTLKTTTAAVNSALPRARNTIDSGLPERSQQSTPRALTMHGSASPFAEMGGDVPAAGLAVTGLQRRWLLACSPQMGQGHRRCTAAGSRCRRSRFSIAAAAS